MARLKIGLATSVIRTEADPDESLQLQAFRDAGHDAEMIAWDDQDADPAQFDAIVLRSTWNYPLDPSGFVDWCTRVASVSVLVNSLEVVQWNIDKIYLSELSAHGLPVVPTVYYERGQHTESFKLFEDWGSIVVKPRVSAGSLYTQRFDPGEEAACQRFLDEMVGERHMMVQPFLSQVETMLEHSVVVVGGEATHVIAKQPRFADGHESVSGALVPSDFEREIVSRVLGALPYPVSYARIDLMPDEDGDPLVSEVELIEPSLFFKQNPAALGPFVEAVVGCALKRSTNGTSG